MSGFVTIRATVPGNILWLCHGSWHIPTPEPFQLTWTWGTLAVAEWEPNHGKQAHSPDYRTSAGVGDPTRNIFISLAMASGSSDITTARGRCASGCASSHKV